MARRKNRKAGKNQTPWYNSNWMLVLVVLAVVAGVRIVHMLRTEQEEPPPDTDETEADAPETEEAAPEAVRLAGAVRYRGLLLDEIVVPMVDRRSCPEHPAGALRVADGKLADVLVWVDGDREQPPDTGAEIHLSGCQMQPRAAVVGHDRPLPLHNDDDVAHEVVATDADGVEITRLLLAPGSRSTLTLRRLGLVRLSCGRHDWEEATLLLVDHPHAAVTDVDGRFDLGTLPPGEVTVRFFHPLLGDVTRPAEIQPDTPAFLEVDLTDGP